MTIDYIPNHVERAVGNLESQFQKSPNLKAVLRAIVGEVQALEDAIYSSTVDRFLNTATGAQLDQYGKVLGAYRGELNDGEYRTILHTRILGNLSSGNVERLIDIYRALNGGAAVAVEPYYPNTLIFSVVHAQPTSVAKRERIRDWMHEVKKGGVALELIEADTNYFGFAGDPDALGFGEGLFAGVI